MKRLLIVLSLVLAGCQEENCASSMLLGEWNFGSNEPLVTLEADAACHFVFWPPNENSQWGYFVDHNQGQRSGTVTFYIQGANDDPSAVGTSATFSYSITDGQMNLTNAP